MDSTRIAPHARVFVVDDVPSMRERLHELLGEIDGVDVVGDAGTPGDAITGILRTHPDYVLLDYQLIDGTGLDVLRAVHPQAPQIGFYLLSNFSAPPYRALASRLGARGFFDKTEEFGRLRDAIMNPMERAPCQP